MQKNIIILFIFAFGISVSLCEENLETINIQPRIMEDTINSTIEDLKTSLPEVINIPLNISLESLNTTILNPSISGIKELLVPHLALSLSGPTLNFCFVLPVLEIDVGYIADMNLLDIMPIYGDGNASIIINDLELTGWAIVSLGPISLKELYIFINLQSVEVNINGLLYDDGFSSFASSLITVLANNLIVTYLNQNSIEIGNALSPTIRDILNSLLSGGTTTTTESTNAESQDVTKAFKIIGDKFVEFAKTL